MRLPQSPSFSASKKTIFQKLIGKVKGAVMALGILSAPLAQAENNAPAKLPSIEEKLAYAEKMNLEGIKSFQELEDTIEYTWSQLKDTPKTPKEIRDKYGHISTEALMWMESDLPKEHLQLLQKYKDTQKKLEKMDKKDPEWGSTEYGLLCLSGLLMALIGYKIGKIPKKDVEKLKREYEEVLGIAKENAVKNALLTTRNEGLEARIREMEQRKGKPWKDEKVVDAEIAEPDADSPPSPASVSSEASNTTKELPEGLKDTFLAQEEFNVLQDVLVTDLASDSPPEEARELEESIRNISNTTGTDHEKAGRLNTMSEKFIVYVESKRLPGHVIHTLLHHFVRSFEGKEFHFGSCPVIGQPFDRTQMLQVGTSQYSLLKVSKVLSLPVLGPNRHPQATTKTITYSHGKVNC